MISTSLLDEEAVELHEKAKERKKAAKKSEKKVVSSFSQNEEDDTEFTPEEGHSSLCATLFGIACFPLTICGSFYCINENEEAVLLSCGKYSGTIREPGIHFANCWGRSIVTVSRAKLSTEIPTTKVIDKNGNPVMVSGVVFFHFKDTKKAALDILDRQKFVADMAAAVLKQIVSHYPYENHDADFDNDDNSGDEASEDDSPCLKQDTRVIGEHLVSELQKRVNVSGAKIDSFRFNEISYAPEIAASLLKKQQASAIIASRHTLVTGAVQIASTAVNKLERRGVAVDQADKARLISNLLTVVCADEHVQPVISLGSTS